MATRIPRDPDKPIVLHLVHVPGEPNQKLEARDQFRMGRQKLLEMTFADFEGRAFAMISTVCWRRADFRARAISQRSPSIAGRMATATCANSLFDPEDYEQSVLAVRAAKSVRIAPPRPIPTLAVTPGRTMRSIMLRGRWSRRCSDLKIKTKRYFKALKDEF